MSAVRSVMQGADLDELNEWLAANGMMPATEYQDAAVVGDRIEATAVVRDNTGKVRTTYEFGVLTQVREYPLVRPLPATLTQQPCCWGIAHPHAHRASEA